MLTASNEWHGYILRFDRMCVVRTRVDAAMKQLPAVDCAFSLPAARGAVLRVIQLRGLLDGLCIQGGASVWLGAFMGIF